MRIIALEGSEGTGKSTVTRLIKDKLSDAGIRAMAFRLPGTTSLGIKIRELVFDKTIPMSPLAQFYMFTADRVQCMSELESIANSKAGLDVAIFDRFDLSTLVYQVVMGQINLELFNEANNSLYSKHKDMIISRVVLKAALDTCIARMQAREDRSSERFKTADVLPKQHAAWESLDQYKQQTGLQLDYTTVDTTLISPEQVAGHIISSLKLIP